MLLGECLGGALYHEDFRRLLLDRGCRDFRIVAESTLSLPGQFAGVRVTTARLGSGETGGVTFWFGFDGTPQTRSSTGVLQPAWSSDGTLQFPGGTTLTVRRVSGLIE